jgi:hypothetical protein
MPDAVTQDQADTAHDEAARQQSRADAKAAAVQQADGTLLGLAFAGLAVAKPGLAGVVLGALAMVCLVASFLVVYVGATRPRGLADRSYGFPAWSRDGLTPSNAPKAVDVDATRVRRLSARTEDIFRHVTTGGDLTAAGLVLLVLAAVATGSGL